MMRTTWCARGLLAIGCASASGCLVDLAGLEAGSEQSDAGDDAGRANDECLQGSSLAGAGAAVNPGCEVECASGWGHDLPALEQDWMVELGLASDANISAVMSLQLDGNVLVALGGDPIRFVYVEPDGTILADLPQALSGSVVALETSVAGDGVVCLLWHDGTTMRLHIAFDLGEWNIELGPLGPASMAAIEDGLVVAYGGELLKVAEEEVVPIADTEGRLAALPGGGMVVANSEGLAWFDAQGNEQASRGLPFAMTVYEVLALDDARVVVIGTDVEASESGFDAIALELSQSEEGWSHRYDRASAWCGDRTHESFSGLARTQDGAIWLAGLDGAEVPFGTFETLQPLVMRIGAEGEALELDRGSWAGRANDVVSTGETVIALLSEEGPEDGLRMWLRKYAVTP